LSSVFKSEALLGVLGIRETEKIILGIRDNWLNNYRDSKK